MELQDLLADLRPASPVGPGISVHGLSYDSRLTRKGDLFFAVPGAHADGHDFLAEVAKKGAAAAVVERKVAAPLPVVHVKSVLAALSKVSNRFYDEPSRKIPVIGITGTNGKTTTSYLIEDILKSAGKTCGVMGTVNYRIGRESWPAPNTTPMSLDVLRFIAEAVKRRLDAVVMEVSSHALELMRVDDVRFSAGVFTNLTQDHLDFHNDMERYFQAKAKLFRRPGVSSVLNVDDDYGRRLAGETKEPLTFGVSSQARVRAAEETCNLNGVQFRLTLPSGKSYAVKNNLLGRHNISNCLAAAGAMMAFGLPEKDVVEGLNQNHAVPGRLERVEAGQDFVVAVDYAHSPDALAQVLSTLRNTGPRRLLCVFGAGGDRDRTKRPKRGRIAAEMADEVFLTSDNPRSEDPVVILKEIEDGIRPTGKKNYRVIENRSSAIREAVREAKAGDIVLIAGKGHETYQIYGDKKHDFSDFAAAREALRA